MASEMAGAVATLVDTTRQCAAQARAEEDGSMTVREQVERMLMAIASDELREPTHRREEASRLLARMHARTHRRKLMMRGTDEWRA